MCRTWQMRYWLIDAADTLVCTGAYLGDEKEDGTARQGKARQKEGADKKVTRGGCRRDAAWVYNETQLGVGCRLFGGGMGRRTWTGGWVATNQSGGNLACVE